VVLAIRSGLGIGAVSDFLTHEVEDLVRVLPELKSPKVDVFFVYPEELRNSKGSPSSATSCWPDSPKCTEKDLKPLPLRGRGLPPGT